MEHMYQNVTKGCGETKEKPRINLFNFEVKSFEFVQNLLVEVHMKSIVFPFRKEL